MDGDRNSNCIGIVGTNNTGKSVVTRLVIERFNKKRDRLKSNGKKYPSNYNKLIVYDPQHNFIDLLREGDIEIILGEDGWEQQVLSLRDSMCVFDDFKNLIDDDRISKDLLRIFGYRMEYGLDLIFVVWHPDLFPPRMYKFIDKYYLFRTNGDDKEFFRRINGTKETVVRCKHILDTEFIKYDELSYKALYPNFPFIYYDTGTNKAVKVNFSK